MEYTPDKFTIQDFEKLNQKMEQEIEIWMEGYAVKHCKHCGHIVHESDDFHDCEVKGMMHDKEEYIQEEEE